MVKGEKKKKQGAKKQTQAGIKSFFGKRGNHEPPRRSSSAASSSAASSAIASSAVASSAAAASRTPSSDQTPTVPFAAASASARSLGGYTDDEYNEEHGEYPSRSAHKRKRLHYDNERNLTAEPEEEEGVPLPPFPADRVKIVSHDAALNVAEGTTIQLNSVSTRSAPALSLPPRSFALGSAADGTPTIVVSTRQEECGNVYLEGPTEVCSEAVAALPDELQSIYRDIDKLDEQRARCEERYMIVRLPQIKRPSPSALAGATSSEVEKVRLHFVDIQRRLLFAAICTLDKSFDACCAKM
ncbi:hypothetical protein THAOC_04726, partial [Thalassiosira oceanica]